MKALIGALIVAFTAGLAIAQVDYVPVPKLKLGTKVGISKKDFDAIKAGLEQNVVALIDGTIPDRDCLAALQDVQYDKATWELVEAYLAQLPKTLPKGNKGGKVTLENYHRLYLICRLTEPLVISKPDVIAEALKTVEPLEPKYGKVYMRYPPCPFLEACKLPPPSNGGIPDVGAYSKMDQNRQKKSNAEQPAILTNQYIGEFESIYCRLMAFAGQQKGDDELLDWIKMNEAGKNYVWKMGIEALITEAASGDMSKERAANLYPKLIEAGKRRFGNKEIQWPPKSRYQDTKDREMTIEWVYRWYTVRCLPQPSLDEITPDFVMTWDYPGFWYLFTAKYMDMVTKGIKDPTNKTLLLVHNPAKTDSPNWKAPDHPTRPWQNDPERWTVENTLHEKPYTDNTGVIFGENGKVKLDPRTGTLIPVK
jgi:hypothetical protein